MAGSTILAGRTVSDLLSAMLCGTIVLVTGFVIGWRPGNGLVGVDRGARPSRWSSPTPSAGSRRASGCSVSDPESAQAVGLIILFPLAFISSCFVPTQGLPSWMRVIADWNPVSAVAARAGSCSATPTRRSWRQLPGPAPGGHGARLEHRDHRDLRPAGHPPAAQAHHRLTNDDPDAEPRVGAIIRRGGARGADAGDDDPVLRPRRVDRTTSSDGRRRLRRVHRSFHGHDPPDDRGAQRPRGEQRR